MVLPSATSPLRCVYAAVARVFRENGKNVKGYSAGKLAGPHLAVLRVTSPYLLYESSGIGFCCPSYPIWNQTDSHSDIKKQNDEGESVETKQHGEWRIKERAEAGASP